MKRFLSLVLALTFFLSAAVSQNAFASGSDYPITITDHAGREVVIDKEPQRLVSCYYITTSLLMALELDEKVVGIEDNPDLRPIYGLSAPELLELPWVGSAKMLDLEACAALEPDLVILPLRLADSAEVLESFGIDVLLVNPESQELLADAVRMVAAAANRNQEAAQLLDFLSETEQYLLDTLTGADAPSVYLSGNSSFLSTAGNAMYQSDMIRLAGGRNVAAALPDSYWAGIDYEQLLAWDPEYIILASSAKYSAEDVLNDPNLAACRAVLNGNVFQIPSNTESWDSPVPGSILGSVWLAGILHPDKIPAAECAGMMDEYYETFYDFSYTQR